MAKFEELFVYVINYVTYFPGARGVASLKRLTILSSPFYEQLFGLR